MARADVQRTHFPGEEIVDAGVRDLAHGVGSVEALCVASAASRLRRAGVEVPENDLDPSGRALYALLEAELGPRAHARYNALTRQVVSYCAARTQDARRRR